MSKLNDLTAITTPSLSDLVYCVQNSTDYKVTNQQLLDLIKTNTVIPLTQAQYDLLTPAEKNNGSIYIITDASITADDVEYSSGVSVKDKLDELALETLTSKITAEQGVTLEQKSLYKQGKMAIMSFVLRVPNINGTILTFTDIFPKETYFNTVKDNDNVIPYLKIERTSTGGRLATDVTKTTNGLVIGEMIFIVD